MPLPLVLGAALALYMAWAIGANDVANAMGTSVGSGALTVAGAVVVARLGVGVAPLALWGTVLVYLLLTRPVS